MGSPIPKLPDNGEIDGVELSYFQGDTAQQLREQGIERGREQELKQAVLRVLHHQGVALSAAHEQRLADCRDVAKLHEWFDRALAAQTAEDVFGERVGRWGRRAMKSLQRQSGSR